MVLVKKSQGEWTIEEIRKITGLNTAVSARNRYPRHLVIEQTLSKEELQKVLGFRRFQYQIVSGRGDLKLPFVPVFV